MPGCNSLTGPMRILLGSEHSHLGSQLAPFALTQTPPTPECVTWRKVLAQGAARNLHNVLAETSWPPQKDAGRWGVLSGCPFPQPPKEQPPELTAH